MPTDLTFGQWAVAALAALFVGLSKTGIPGIGILAIALFANVIPARESAGVVLPLLICADVVAVAAYLREARWSHLLRLFPWAIAGILAGWLAMDHINSVQTARLIGVILVGMSGFQFYRKRRQASRAGAGTEEPPHGIFFAPVMGLLAGFTTMVANAAGPIMNLYLLAMRLPKMQFLGTAAWYFFLLNSFKVPFSVHLGLINRESLVFDLKLAPAVLGGALFGRWLVPFINQALFERLALGLALLAGVRLLFQS